MWLNIQKNNIFREFRSKSLNFQFISELLDDPVFWWLSSLKYQQNSFLSVQFSLVSSVTISCSRPLYSQGYGEKYSEFLRNNYSLFMHSIEYIRALNLSQWRCAWLVAASFGLSSDYFGNSFRVESLQTQFSSIHCSKQRKQCRPCYFTLNLKRVLSSF